METLVGLTLIVASLGTFLILSSHLFSQRRKETEQEDVSRPITDDRVRWLLAQASIVFVIISLASYLITRDLGTLGMTTITGIIVGLVYGYYFHKK